MKTQSTTHQIKFIMPLALFFCFILSDAFSQTVWDGTSDTDWYDPSITIFDIDTPEELAGLATLVNNGTSNFSGKTINLETDIWLNENGSTTRIWIPIGGDATASSEQGINPKEFKGNFNGNCHTIYNLYVNKPSYYQAGLFGAVSGSINIENITLVNPYIKSKGMAGAVAGMIKSGGNTYIKNCLVVNLTLESSIGNNVGGIAGAGYPNLSNRTYIQNCGVTGNITGQYAGGIIGNGERTDITNCYFAGTITLAGGINRGGIYAYNAGNGSQTNSYSNITSSGDGHSGTIKTNVQMQELSFVTGLNTGGDYFKMDCGINDNYPILSCYFCGLQIRGDTVICTGETTILTVSGNYDYYLWNTGETTSVISVSPAVTTTYSVTATDSYGFDFDGNITVTILDYTTPQFNQLGPFCLNETVPVLPSTSDNGIAGIWNPSIIDSSVTGRSTYTFSANSGECINDTIMEINIDEITTPEFIQLGPYCLYSTPGILETISANGITGTWSPAVINTSGIGTVTHTFTPDAGQCAATETMNIDVSHSIIPTFDQLGPYCINSIPDDLPQTSLNGITGTWIPSIINTGATETTTYRFNPDAGQSECVDHTTMTIEIVSKPKIQLSVGSAIKCKGDENAVVNLIIQNGNPEYTIDWGNGTHPSLTGTYRITGLPAGYTHVTVTDIYGCTGEDSILIDEPPELSVNVDYDNYICHGESASAIINATGGTGQLYYIWADRTTSNMHNNIPTNSNFGYTVTDENLCSVTGNIQIRELDEFNINISVENVSCNGLSDGTAFVSFVRGGFDPIDYIWSNSSMERMLSGLSPGIYTVTATDFYGCHATSSINITEPSPVIINYDVTDAECTGQTGSISILPSGGNSGYSYNWYHGPTSRNLANVLPGEYSLTVTDSKNCMASETIVVNTSGYIPVEINLLNSISCFNDENASLEVSTASLNPPFNLIWSTNDTIPVIENLKSGTYSVTISGIWGCTGSGSYFIDQPTEIVINDEISHVRCYGENSGRITTFVTGGSPGYYYAWSTGDKTSYLTNVTEGSYFLTVTDKKGCKKVKEYNIQQASAPLSFNAEVKDILCYGQKNGQININASGGYKPYYCQVSNNEYFAQGLIHKELKAGKYSIIVRDKNGCHEQSEVNIISPPKLNAIMHATGPSCFGNNNGSIMISVTGGVEPYTYNINGVDSEINYFEGLISDDYLITVTDTNGCYYGFERFILEENADIDCIKIPNAFTPNGDGINDLWIIENIDLFPNVTIDIFNRWGQNVYSTRGYEDPWDGKYNGKPVSTGSYVYVIDLNHKGKRHKGTVTVMY